MDLGTTARENRTNYLLIAYQTMEGTCIWSPDAYNQSFTFMCRLCLYYILNTVSLKGQKQRLNPNLTKANTTFSSPIIRVRAERFDWDI